MPGETEAGAAEADARGARDVVFVRGLEARAHLGVTADEQRRAQPLRVDLDLACDVARAAASDALEDAVDYHAVCDAVLAYAEGHRHRLVETYAERIAALVCRDFGVARVRVRVEKPGALPFAAGVGVVVEREA